jgi:hypothetical protein
MIERAKWHEPRLGKSRLVKHVDYLRSLSPLEWLALIMILGICSLPAAIGEAGIGLGWLQGSTFFLFLMRMTFRGPYPWTLRRAQMKRLKQTYGEQGCPVLVSFYGSDYHGSDRGVAWIQDGLLHYFGNRTEFRVSVEDLPPPVHNDYLYVNSHLVVDSVNLEFPSTGTQVKLLPLIIHPARYAGPEAMQFLDDVRNWYKEKPWCRRLNDCCRQQRKTRI